MEKLQGARSTRGKRRLTETLAVCSAGVIEYTTDASRLFYTLTSPDSDVILQVEPLMTPTLVSRTDKELILGQAGLQRREHGLHGDEQVPLLVREKDHRCLQEVLHQLRAGRVVTCTPGSGHIIKAVLELKLTALLLARNDAHVAQLTAYGLSVLKELCKNPDSIYWFNRKAVIESLGLDPDASRRLRSA